MVIITGSILATDSSIEELLRLGLEHTRRSRLEPGCVSHDITRDVENPLRIWFFERWADKAAVATHFAVPESGDFVRTAMSMAAQPPTLDLYDATTTSV
jgi:quinol monooxygenase YgiN